MTVAHYDGYTYDFGRTPKKDLEEVINQIERNKPLKPVSIFIPSTKKHSIDLDSLKSGNPRLTSSANHILTTLSTQKYPNELIIGFDQAEKEMTDIFRQLLPEFPYRAVVIWNDDPRIKQWEKKLKTERNYNILPGKGLNLWKTLIYVFEQKNRYKDAKAPVCVAHDMDIHPSVYNETFVPFLVHPIIHPQTNMNFVKAYYERVRKKDKFNYFMGRMRRHLIGSLLLALKRSLIGNNTYVGDIREYLGSYKYHLSGEIAIDPDLIHEMEIPPDRALEIGMLLNMYGKNKRIGQADLIIYDHEHSPLSSDDPEKGLYKMGVDIDKFILRKIDAGGVKELSEKAVYESIKSHLKNTGNEMLNGTLVVTKNRPSFDFDPEERDVRDMCIDCFELAYSTYKEHPRELAQLPNVEKIPVIYRDRFMDIVEDQNPFLKEMRK